MNFVRLLGIGLALIVLAQIVEFVLKNVDTAVIAVIILGIISLVGYILFNPLLLPSNRKKLVSQSKEFIDSLEIKDTNGMKTYLSNTANEHMFIPEQVQEFTLKVEQTLVHAIALAKIHPHLATLRRKKTQNIYKDDYGVAHTKNWIKECEYFIDVVLLPLSHPLPVFLKSTAYYDLLNDQSNSRTIEYWVKYLDDLVDAGDSRIYLNDLELMSGHDYETFVGNIVEDCNWLVQVTKGSGDQGADVIAERDGVRIVIQCKLYASTVGNKAVQEVFAAKSFYDCDYAFVVSNSTYTPSARKIAERTEVQLLHHDELPQILKNLST